MIILLVYIIGCVLTYILIKKEEMGGGDVWTQYDRLITLLGSLLSWIILIAATVDFLQKQAGPKYRSFLKKIKSRPAKW